EAVDKISLSPEGYYDFVFMDIMMPKMDGNEATRNIRNLDRVDTKTLPIVALSANAFKADVAQAIDAGMDNHLAKPVDYENMMQILAEKIK
ncbi:MAG: response regulator, partial [Clostridiales Family XIII bacterium]|nr:response regulator [Clostridiales Family XIII bacterium]